MSTSTKKTTNNQLATADVIRVRGAATHNLRSVDLDLPRNQLVVFCGVSGSGKTSMAIDTLYAEGQRRYIESFSAYTRQFLEQMEKPEFDHIDGLPPAIAVTQRGVSRSNRATVATVTEVADHLRLLFARIGEVVCPDCQQSVRRDTVDQIVETLSGFAEGTKLMLGFALTIPKVEDQPAWIAELIETGYVRLVAGGVTLSLSPDLAEPLTTGDEAFVLIDRLVAGRQDEGRVAESIETATHAGQGSCVVFSEASDSGKSLSIDGRDWSLHRFSTRLRCESCQRDFVEPEPRLFDFNSPLGACSECEGFGSIVEEDIELIVPDKTKTLREGAIAPWNTPAYSHELEELLALAADYDLPVDVPFSELTEKHRQLIQHGVPEREFGGLDGFFAWLERRKYKMHLRVYLSRWRSYRQCPACHGARLGPDALAVEIDGKNLAQITQLKVTEAAEILEQLTLSDWQAKVGRVMLDQIRDRFSYLQEVGVGYLPLDRSLRTLSSGESQRVAMTSTLGSNLVDTLYVFDEPSTGLHAADVPALAAAIRRVRDRGNTVVVVEHEESIIDGADQIVEFGPQAGIEGGEIVFQGTPAELLKASGSRTGDWIAGRRTISSSTRRTPNDKPIQLRGATGNNLQGSAPNAIRRESDAAGLDVDIPLGVLCVVTGVSGAGKSSLVGRTLYPALAERFGSGKSSSSKANGNDKPLPYGELLGTGVLDSVQWIDRQPVARSPRSNPVTYIKAFDPIRTVFAEQPDAQARGFTAGHFSFNVEGGRCEMCQGAGHLVVDMQFLADVTMRCGDCDGQRYRREVLEIKYRGRDIAEVLDMTALEAFRFFRGHPKVQSRLKSLLDVGLNYVRLGQPASTLSGGESQRLKLAGSLAAKPTGRTLFVLDEPTTGLHFSDIAPLVDCFDALIDVGHSLLVIEHNVQLMLAADWIIDLGPGPAEAGGQIVAQGTPEQVAKCAESLTGQAIAEALRREAIAQAELDADEEALEEDIEEGLEEEEDE